MTRLVTVALLIGAATAAAAGPGPALDSVYRFYVTRDFDRAESILRRLEGEFESGAAAFEVQLELGDFLLDKREDYAGAEEVYSRLLDEFPKEKRLPDVRYRLALAQELQEKFLEAAQNYEVVATRHMKSRFGTDALDAIERCFRKNYQDRVAYVDGYPITRIELDDRISRNPVAFEAWERKVELLDTMIDNRLLAEAARESGVMALPEFAPGFVETRNRYVFEEWYEREVNQHAEPTEKQLRAQYKKDRADRFTTPEKVHAWQLVVADKALADSLRLVLLSDAAVTWDSLVLEHSTAPDRERGGDMGLFARGVHPKPVEDAAFKLKPGEVSRPVRTDEGWVLLRVTEKKPKVVRPYDEVKSQLVVQLRQDNTNRLYEEKLDELKRRAGYTADTTALFEGRDTLAVVGGTVIDNAALDARIEQIPVFFRGQFQTPEGRVRILEQLVAEKLILEDAEAKDAWLWNRAMNKVLERRPRLLIDAFRQLETRVTVDSAELAAEYRATIEEFKVPAQVHARQIQAPTRARAEQLRRWAVAGRLPAVVEGRGLVVRDEAAVAVLRDSLAELDNCDALIAEHGFSNAPGAVLPNTPTLRVAGRLVPDISAPCPKAGPYGDTDTPAVAFGPVTPEDALYLPAFRAVNEADELVEWLGTTPRPDSTAELLVDSSRFGTYVTVKDRAPSGWLKSLFELEQGAVAEPLELADGRLLVKVVANSPAREADFADIARKFSSAPDRYSGGDLYWLTRDDQARDRRLVDAAFNTAEGRVSPVIKLGDSNYVFVKVEEEKAAYTRPLEEVRDKLERKLAQEKEAAAFDALIERLRANANIEVVMTPEDFIFEPLELEGEEPLQPLEEEGTPADNE